MKPIQLSSPLNAQQNTLNSPHSFGSRDIQSGSRSSLTSHREHQLRESGTFLADQRRSSLASILSGQGLGEANTNRGHLKSPNRLSVIIAAQTIEEQTPKHHNSPNRKHSFYAGSRQSIQSSRTPRVSKSQKMSPLSKKSIVRIESKHETDEKHDANKKKGLEAHEKLLKIQKNLEILINQKNTLNFPLEIEKLFNKGQRLKKRRRSCCCEWCGGVSGPEKKMNRDIWLNLAFKKRRKKRKSSIHFEMFPEEEPKEEVAVKSVSPRSRAASHSKGKVKLTKQVNSIKTLIRLRSLGNNEHDLDALDLKKEIKSAERADVLNNSQLGRELLSGGKSASLIAAENTKISKNDLGPDSSIMLQLESKLKKSLFKQQKKKENEDEKSSSYILGDDELKKNSEGNKISVQKKSRVKVAQNGRKIVKSQQRLTLAVKGENDPRIIPLPKQEGQQQVLAENKTPPLKQFPISPKFIYSPQNMVSIYSRKLSSPIIAGGRLSASEVSSKMKNSMYLVSEQYKHPKQIESARLYYDSQTLASKSVLGEAKEVQSVFLKKSEMNKSTTILPNLNADFSPRNSERTKNKHFFTPTKKLSGSSSDTKLVNSKQKLTRITK